MWLVRLLGIWRYLLVYVSYKQIQDLLEREIGDPDQLLEYHDFLKAELKKYKPSQHP